jgi:hypothetical protein
MTLTLPPLRIGDPLRHESLSVFPLFTPPGGGVDYRLADEALADSSLTVEEISQAGSVPELLVENKGDTRVLFLEGEELVGAKQNRILNTSVLVAAHTKIKIPVSCVEQGRWRHTSHYFGSSGSHSPSSIRYALKKSVSDSVSMGGGYRSDQGEVWSKVREVHAMHGTSSVTGAMSDAFAALDVQRRDFAEKLGYVDGAIGLAVAVGDKVLSADVFDKPETCQKVWRRLLSGVILDAMAAKDAVEPASVELVEKLLASAGSAGWKQVKPIGEGEDYRAEIGGDRASALTLHDTLVHGSVVLAV